ncbi:translation initiation factor IF-2-like [Vulpes lagopus]|uniref:translation initiation factor IF-2-like n=1 Tax=Vulpes lagopus TaxID=494514 RepID=UPI001BC95125|nr:translation initiation factor IF-2-like [Vulpes lagopus]
MSEEPAALEVEEEQEEEEEGAPPLPLLASPLSGTRVSAQPASAPPPPSLLLLPPRPLHFYRLDSSTASHRACAGPLPSRARARQRRLAVPEPGSASTRRSADAPRPTAGTEASRPRPAERGVLAAPADRTALRRTARRARDGGAEPRARVRRRRRRVRTLRADVPRRGWHGQPPRANAHSGDPGSTASAAASPRRPRPLRRQWASRPRPRGRARGRGGAGRGRRGPRRPWRWPQWRGAEPPAEVPGAVGGRDRRRGPGRRGLPGWREGGVRPLSLPAPPRSARLAAADGAQAEASTRASHSCREEELVCVMVNNSGLVLSLTGRRGLSHSRLGTRHFNSCDYERLMKSGAGAAILQSLKREAYVAKN